MRENNGALFSNNKGAENHPDLRGDITIGGRKYRLSGWYRTDRNGQRYISLQAQEDGPPPASAGGVEQI